VLDVEKIGANYLFLLLYICDASVGAKEGSLVCMLASYGSSVEQPALVASNS